MLRIGIAVALVGFFGVALLLATDHVGRATELGGYLFLLLFVLVFYDLLSNEIR